MKSGFAHALASDAIQALSAGAVVCHGMGIRHRRISKAQYLTTIANARSNYWRSAGASTSCQNINGVAETARGQIPRSRSAFAASPPGCRLHPYQAGTDFPVENLPELPGTAKVWKPERRGMACCNSTSLLESSCVFGATMRENFIMSVGHIIA
jgi:hypothetical protein